MGPVEEKLQQICQQAGPITRDDERAKRVALWLVREVIRVPEGDITVSFSIGTSPEGVFLFSFKKGNRNSCFMISHNRITYLDVTSGLRLSYVPGHFKIPHLENLKKSLIGV